MLGWFINSEKFFQLLLVMNLFNISWRKFQQKIDSVVLLQSANILSNYLINENSIHEISLICTLALIAFEDQSFKTFTLCYWAANTFGLFTFIRLSPIHWPYRLKCCICIHHYCMIWLMLPVNYVRYIVRLAIDYIIFWFLTAFLATL